MHDLPTDAQHHRADPYKIDDDVKFAGMEDPQCGLQVFIALPPQESDRCYQADRTHGEQYAYGFEQRCEAVVVENVIEQVRDLLGRV